MDYARTLCDKLLGTDRNEHPSKATGGTRYYNPDVCKRFLVGFCPYQVFTNTRSDLGRCDKRLHEEYLIRDYDRNGEREREEYELDLYRLLEKLINDVDKKGRRGHDRLQFKATDDVMQMLNPNKDENDEKIVEFEAQVKEKLQKIEQLGEQGRIQEAQDLTQEVDKLNLEIERLKSIEDANPLLKLEKRMAVCEVCGCLLVMNEDPRRMELHLSGKQHLGYIKVRELFDQFRAKYGDLGDFEGQGRREYGGGRRDGGYGGGQRDGNYGGGGRGNRRDSYRREDRRGDERRDERRDDRRYDKRDNDRRRDRRRSRSPHR